MFTAYCLVLQYMLLCLDATADHFVQLEMHSQGPRELQGRTNGDFV